MASGDTLDFIIPQRNEPPSSAAATPDRRNGHPVLDFDAATDENAVFTSLLPQNYDGGGLTVRVGWMASTATTGDVVWDLAIESHTAEADDLDSDSFATAQSATTTTAGTSGHIKITTITFTSGAQMDSWAAGETGRLKLTRNANVTADSMAGDAEFRFMEIRET